MHPVTNARRQMNDRHRRTSALSRASRAESTHGYLASSFDLRDGLEVELLAISTLSADVLRELQRLRLCWAKAPTPMQTQALR